MRNAVIWPTLSQRDKAGTEELRPCQLHVFDQSDRDDHGWVMSVAHLVVVREDFVAGVEITPIDAVDLVYDDATII